ncbi:ABC transporter permease [Zavarzinia compransoris]|uniref:Sulfonate ABC transporter n=1 Tax=Zavarzinia compransoris TaxID=1264899 RepID=A0A317DT04_9PROT|nr:ABC transporter permease [Zavarzinia compransoris]PWR17799.1 sulfonate ABC transporter [Zavarzinia compransoris]TDP49331.1 sulfonate transport system permease protein [Zavarzinia compransoris]
MAAVDVTLPALPGAPARRARWRGLGRAAAGLAVPLLLLGAWQAAHAYGLVAEQVLPAPALVWQTLLEVAGSGELSDNLSISLFRVALGFVIGAAIGLALGAVMGLSPRVERVFRPTLILIAIIPVVGWLPLLMLLLGIGEALKITIIAKAAFTPVVLATMNGFRQVPEAYFEVGRVYRLSRRQVLRRIVLPAALLPVFTGLRNGLTTAWVTLVVVEMLASTEGIGYLMVWGRQLFQLDLMLAMMAVIGIIGYVMDRVLVTAEAGLQRRFGGRVA